MWLYVPSLPESLCAQASPCLTKDAALHSSILDFDGELPVTSKGKLLQPRSLQRLWKRAVWMRRLSGLTLSPSQAVTGVAAWIASLPVSPVSHTASPGSAQDLMTSDGSGRTLSGLLATWDRASCVWRTSQASLLPEDSTPASAILPRWGTARNGRCFLRLPLALHTNASGSSSSRGWPTPDANTSTYSNGYNGHQNIREVAATWKTPHGMSGMDHTGKIGSGGEFAKQATNWATPRASDGEKGGPNCVGSRGDPILPGQASQWMTPNVPNGGRRLSAEEVAHKGKTANGKRQVGLEMQTEYWPTPQAHDAQGGKTPEQIEAMRAKGHGVANLNERVEQWPTPAARDHKGANSTEHVTAIGGQKAHGSVSELCGAFAPGPVDPRWARIVADFPYVAPATEPGVRLLAHGVAYLVDESRTDQLRSVGNGVVALTAAAAFVRLARRAGIAS